VFESPFDIMKYRFIDITCRFLRRSEGILLVLRSIRLLKILPYQFIFYLLPGPKCDLGEVEKEIIQAVA
jgi:hypothetical protein